MRRQRERAARRAAELKEEMAQLEPLSEPWLAKMRERSRAIAQSMSPRERRSYIERLARP